MFNDWDISSLWVQTVHQQTAVSCQRRGQALQPGLLLILVALIVEIYRHGLLGEFRGGAESQVCGKFAFDWCRSLELIVDLNADTSTSFFELCWDIGRPLCSVGPDLTHLQQERGDDRDERTRQMDDGFDSWQLKLQYVTYSICIKMSTNYKGYVIH